MGHGHRQQRARSCNPCSPSTVYATLRAGDSKRPVGFKPAIRIAPERRAPCCRWVRGPVNVAHSHGAGRTPFPKKRVPSMCDYSLHAVATRPAKIEDKLVTTRFNNSITRGFAAVGEPNVAVCLLPGTEIAFDDDVKCERWGSILPSKNLRQRLARFRQFNVDYATIHHDTLEFPDGQVVLLTRSASLPAQDHRACGARDQSAYRPESP